VVDTDLKQKSLSKSPEFEQLTTLKLSVHLKPLFKKYFELEEDSLQFLDIPRSEKTKLSSSNFYEVFAIGAILHSLRKDGFNLEKEVAIVTPFDVQKHILSDFYADTIASESKNPKIALPHEILKRKFSVIICSMVVSSRSENYKPIEQQEHNIRKIMENAHDGILFVGNLKALSVVHGFAKDIAELAKALKKVQKISQWINAEDYAQNMIKIWQNPIKKMNPDKVSDKLQQSILTRLYSNIQFEYQREQIPAMMSLYKDYLYSAKYIDMVDTWYGHPNIPIGKVVNGKKGNLTYAKKIVDMKENGKPVFKSSITDYKKLPEAVKLYRKLLWQADDSSVVIISVGFSTNLARLLKSGSDNIAPVSGKELVGKKVKFLSMMGGCFDGSIEREHNIIFDVHSAFELFEEWPTNIVVSPFEVGVKIRYPAVSIEHDFSYVRHHPVADAYKLFLKMPYNRPCWDLTSVLYAVEQDSSWFTLSPMGRVSVDTLTGKTFFTEVEGGSHRYLSVDSLCAAKIKQRLVQLVTLVPGRYRKTYSASILPVAYDRNNHQ